jgi:hypothetical protein
MATVMPITTLYTVVFVILNYEVVFKGLLREPSGTYEEFKQTRSDKNNVEQPKK